MTPNRDFKGTPLLYVDYLRDNTRQTCGSDRLLVECDVCHVCQWS